MRCISPKNRERERERERERDSESDCDIAQVGRLDKNKSFTFFKSGRADLQLRHVHALPDVHLYKYS